MGAKLEAFIKLFDQKSNDKIAESKNRIPKREADVAEFIKLRNATIAAASESDAKLISETFPEQGGMPFDPANTAIIILSEGPFAKEARLLFKLVRTPVQLDRANRSLANYKALKSAGGESWFKKYMSAIGSKIAETISTGASTSDELFKSFFPDTFNEDNQGEIAYHIEPDLCPDPPTGVYESLELYEAGIENGNPLVKQEETPVVEEAPEVKEEVKAEETVVEEEVKAEEIVVKEDVKAEETQDVLNETTEEEKVKYSEKFSASTAPINDTLDKPKVDINKAIEPSINAGESAPRKLIKIGSKGKDVEFLQKSLGTVEVDGKFGPNTKAAVIVFQKANELDPDGIAGPKTWAAILKLQESTVYSFYEFIKRSNGLKDSLNYFFNGKK